MSDSLAQTMADQRCTLLTLLHTTTTFDQLFQKFPNMMSVALQPCFCNLTI